MGKLLKQAVRLTVLFILLGFSNGIYAQKAITGVVKDAANGGTLPGVNVTVKEKAGVGTVTDIDGKFSLKLPEGAKTLVFSFIGYTSQDVAIAGKTSIEVQLQADARKLDEVVVTALGIKRQTKALGYAVTEVKGDELAKSNTVSPISALQGKIAGVSIGGSDGGMFGGSKMSIRGVSTLAGNNRPIFVIDGVILDNTTSGESEWSESAKDWGNQLKNLNPDDFESVSVLKGSAATALYGSRGLNGAVVITTKTAKAGKGLGVSVSHTTGVDLVYKTPSLQNEFGAGTMASYNESFGSNRFSTNQFYETQYNGKTVPSLYGNDNLEGLSWGPRFDGREILGYDHKMTTYKAYKDNMKDAYDLGVNTNTNISVQGGNEKTKIYVSESYSYRKGIFPGNEFGRNSLLLKGVQKLNDKISLEASLSFVHSTPKNTAGDLGNYFLGALPRSYDTKYYKDKYYSDHGGIPNSKYGDALGDVPGAGMWFGINNTNTNRVENSVIPIIKVVGDVTDWLKLTAEGNMNVYNYKSETKELGGGYKNEGGSYALEQFRKQQINGKLTASFHKTFNDISTNFILGSELFSTTQTKTGIRTDGGLIVPGQYFIDNSKLNPITDGKIEYEKKMASLYYLFNASWRDQLYLDITGRNDWSSALVYKDGTGNFAYFYPSVSTSWLFSQSFKLPEWVSFGKLRFSWAQVGNDTDPYVINPAYSIGKIQSSGSSFIYTNSFDRTLIDRSLKPERKNAFEVGADVRLFDNRLGIDVTLYKENTRNQIVDIPAPIESGSDWMKINAGDIQNKGIELSIKTVPIRTNDFEWDLDFTYTKNQNKIISLHKNVGDYKLLAGFPTYGNYRVGSVAYIGGEYGVLLSDAAPKKFQALDSEGKPIDDPRNGLEVLNYSNYRRGAYALRSGQVEKIGTTLPKFEGSISNTLKYKNVNLSFLIDARFGGYLASYSNRYGTAYGFTETSLYARDQKNGGVKWTSKFDGVTYEDGVIPNGVFADGLEVVTPQGNKVNVGGMTFKEAYEKGYVEPTHASYWTFRRNDWNTGVANNDWVSEIKYIALRQLSLGYSVANSFTKKIGLSNLYVSLDARNVCYLYNSLPNNLNPESTRGNSSSYSYFERTFSPYVATYSFTVKFNF